MVDTAGRRTHGMFWAIGAGYVLCWVVGLLIGGPSINHGSGSEEIQTAFSTSPGVLIQVVLVHGFAAAFLAALGLLLASGTGGRYVLRLAVAASVLSLVQLGGELALILVPIDIDAAAVWDAITRVDGVKMFVLAGFVAAVPLVGAGKPRLLSVISAVTALALVLSGCGYLAVNPPLMASANASLPLLLIWVLAVTAARTSELRRAAVPQP